MMLSVFGGLNSAVGAWYETNAQRGQLQSKKLSLEFESSMSHLNARRAERQAQQLLRAGERDIERYTMRAGQERAAAVAAQGARGVEGGVGSAVEELVSRDVVTALDVGSLSENAARAAGEARIQGVNFQNQAAIADVSAQNVARTRRTIRPGLAAASDLLSSAGTVASYWYGRRGGY
jgi:hypothetical protein